ncbi:TPA: hypothetical protein KBW33_002907 [Escherichia coli]|uniref:hypothetical protein n=1 Tax=Escherichia coli TaxID=562 RepID=UPI001812C27F|nr:hypothetical protein [Escherichia coli]HAI0759255.1 hypothetical protein [Escherichia coli]HBB5838520.1 hypothetical protein [Escherichia coli]HBN0254539.1 hypothetical protein [Escherichia coli]
MAFLCSVKSWRGIFAGGLLIKGAWTEQTVEIYSWLVARVSLMLAYAKTWHLKE